MRCLILCRETCLGFYVWIVCNIALSIFLSHYMVRHIFLNRNESEAGHICCYNHDIWLTFSTDTGILIDAECCIAVLDKKTKKYGNDRCLNSIHYWNKQDSDWCIRVFFSFSLFKIIQTFNEWSKKISIALFTMFLVQQIQKGLYLMLTLSVDRESHMLHNIALELYVLDTTD